ncbi:Lrp/AsnC family transcriptional regulator [Ramlibacter sp. PS4R-6]|uniref:Lrp/AsnC family transcriptional regulator n=1 Tax=Ramlibacter sp. PS4R-6 TaxID=3133438 RepID=UPI0030A60B30
MDAKDRLLLAYLQRNARSTAVELAGRLGLSRSSVQARIARLERTGVISGYTVILRQKPSHETLRSWLLVTMEKDGDSAQLLARMREIPGIGAIYLLTGELDFMVEAVAATPLAIDDVRKEVAHLPGIADIRTHLVLRASLPDPAVSLSMVARFDEEEADEIGT